MMDYDKFRHDRSQYERPNQPFVCGRAAEFGKPCAKGPGADGSCGGCFECEPAQKGDRFECTRPAALGGKCENGPNSDGSCCMQRPPCTPKPTIRRRRGQFTALAIAASIALIVIAIGTTFLGTETPLAMDPGQLSASHQAFSKDKGCAACHGDVDTPEKFLTAAVSHNKMDAQCTECHSFAGPAEAAHNSSNPDILAGTMNRNGGDGLSCASCHSEHEGLDASLVDMTDAQCNTCHMPDKHVSSFSKNHPEFSAGYPYDRRTSLRFDHNAHFGKYFDQVSAGKPESCLTCHAVDRQNVQARRIEPVGFDGACQTCHAEDIPKRELTLFVLPEMDEQILDMEEFAETCEIELDADILEADFESVSLEEPTPITGILTESDISDSASYTEPVQEFIGEMAEFGLEALQDRVSDKFGDDAARQMLAGLSNSMVQKAACAWALNQEYEPGDDEVDSFGGWYATENALVYKPSIVHPDRVIKAWIDAGIALKVSGDVAEDAEDSMDEMVTGLLSPKGGAGNCASCHAFSVVDEEMAAKHNEVASIGMEWSYQESDNSPHVFYDHGPHLNILGPGSTCTNCHQIDKEANFAASFDDPSPFDFSSNFKPITVETCQECHGEKQVKSDCQTCHKYHNSPGFNPVMTMGKVATKEN